MNRIILRAKSLVAPALLILLLSACSSGISRSPEMLSAPKVYFGENNQQAGSISIGLTAEAEQVAATTTRINQNEILQLVRRGLEVRNALTKEADSALPKIEILITSVRSRSAFNAVMWGFMAGDDHIKGDVIVRSPVGGELQRFAVSASYALGGFAGGQTEARMGWLYETFAKHVVDELTGTKAKPSPPSPVS